MTIISIMNQKGGVGKTTVSVNLASSLSQLGNKVLLADLDPQGNSTTGLGIDKKNIKNSVYDLLENSVVFKDVVIETTSKVDLLPSEISLSTFDINYYAQEDKEFMLKKQLTGLQYDYIIVDCPPTLGLLTINSLTASNYVLVPVVCEFYPIEGISQVITTIDLIKGKLNKNLKLGGIILNMFDSRLKIQKEILKELQSYFKDKIFKTFIPKSVKLVEASSHGLPINIYSKNSKINEIFIQLSEEVLKLK